MEKLCMRELVYSVSETSLWGQFLLSLKFLKYGVRGRAADNPPEVDICELLTANSTQLLPNTTDPSRWMRGPLRRRTSGLEASEPPVRFTSPARSCVEKTKQERPPRSRPSVAVHALEPQMPLAADAWATPCPEIRLRGPPVEYDHNFCLRGRK